MITRYPDTKIQFVLEQHKIDVQNIVFEQFTRIIPAHSHGENCYEIHYIPSGYGKLNTDGACYDITPNTLFVTGPHITHAQIPLFSNPMSEYCIYLKLHDTITDCGAFPVLSAFCNVTFWFGQAAHRLPDIITQFFHELEHQYIGYQSQAESLLSQMIISLVRCYNQWSKPHHATTGQTMKQTESQPSKQTAPPKQTRLQTPKQTKAQTSIQTRTQTSKRTGTQTSRQVADTNSIVIEEYFLYEYPSLSLDALAGRLHLSPRQTQRLLQKYYGKTFQQKKAEARMSAAALLLEDQEQSITSIANLLGYSSGEHFSSAFRKYFNISPRDYRKKCGESPD